MIDVRASDIVGLIIRRSGLTRRELAARAGIGRATLSRWEHGEQEPSLRALERLAAAAGLTISVDVLSADDSLAELVDDQLLMSPQQRLAARLDSRDRADTEAALWWVAGRRWRVVVIGPVAGVLQGAPERPRDGVIDLVPESMLRASDVLLSTGAAPGDDEDRSGDLWELPDGGRVRVHQAPAGTHGFADLARHAATLSLERAGELPRTVRVADVADLLRIAMTSPDTAERSRRPGLEALLAHGRHTEQAA
jgi:transcriptional regulator with XRE-family HTH domain